MFVLQLSFWAVLGFLSANVSGLEGQVLEDTAKSLLWLLQRGRVRYEISLADQGCACSVNIIDS